MNKVLIKKALGFYYSEEALEYNVEQKPSLQKHASQVSFFDEEGCDCGTKKPKRKSSKSVSVLPDSENLDVKCSQMQENIVASSLGENLRLNENQQTLTLSKKKITTHYVPPDMLAIKMLLENSSKTNLESIENLSDEELIERIKELSKELNI
ncbi:MAG: hypothetical protein IJS68_03330 [Clostridia bacterium]|nr:hypothetical protein [Clostridia bacterium]